MNEQIRLYEELSFNSHPSLQTQYYDGWILRFSNGYTNRANSVNMIYSSTIDLQTKIAVCEERYFSEHQPCVFKVTDGNDEKLDSLLADKGYQVVTPTNLMSMDLTDKQFEAGNCIITEQLSEEWLHTYFALENCTDVQMQSTAKQMLDMIQNKTLYCRIVEAGKSVACASAVIERGYMTLVHVVVDEAYRGRGYGRKVCEALLFEAKQQGAHTAYLQVVQNNKVAINLYEKLGYKKLYSYWYRVKKSMPYKFRPLTDSDYNFIYQVKKDAYKNYVEMNFGSWNEEDQQGYFAKFMEAYKDGAVIITKDGIDIGFYNGEVVDDTYEIGNICIIPEYQNRGIGTAILKDILDANRDRTVTLQYFKQNPVGRLYERLGFKVVGETKFHYQMSW